MAHVGKHAIVVGAGMGGLLAARALADHFDEVTILETRFRIRLIRAKAYRKDGIRTDCLPVGARYLSSRFPGLLKE
jgi:monoamine oxidase